MHNEIAEMIEKKSEEEEEDLEAENLTQKYIEQARQISQEMKMYRGDLSAFETIDLRLQGGTRGFQTVEESEACFYNFISENQEKMRNFLLYAVELVAKGRLCRPERGGCTEYV